MQIFKANEPKGIRMQPGRKCFNSFAPNSAENVPVPQMAGYANFSKKYGSMDTHFHGNEYMYVIEAYNATTSIGMGEPEDLRTEALYSGEIVRMVDGEWHRFDFLTENGYVRFLNFFADFRTLKVTNSADYYLQKNADKIEAGSPFGEIE